jgi:peroxiredoxin
MATDIGRTRAAGLTAALALVALALAGCGGAGGAASAPPSTGAPSAGPKAPDFTLPTLSGDRVSLGGLRGKVVLIDFWSTTCDPCLQEMPELVRLYKEKKNQGFEVLAISVDGPETLSQVSSVAQRTGMIFPVLLDEDTRVMDRYNPKGEMPFTLVVDRAGVIVLKRSGYLPGDKESSRKLLAAIDGALAR